MCMKLCAYTCLSQPFVDSFLGCGIKSVNMACACIYSISDQIYRPLLDFRIFLYCISWQIWINFVFVYLNAPCAWDSFFKRPTLTTSKSQTQNSKFTKHNRSKFYHICWHYNRGMILPQLVLCIFIESLCMPVNH